MRSTLCTKEPWDFVDRELVYAAIHIRSREMEWAELYVHIVGGSVGIPALPFWMKGYTSDIANHILA